MVHLYRVRRELKEARCTRRDERAAGAAAPKSLVVILVPPPVSGELIT